MISKKMLMLGNAKGWWLGKGGLPDAIPPAIRWVTASEAKALKPSKPKSGSPYYVVVETLELFSSTSQKGTKKKEKKDVQPTAPLNGKDAAGNQTPER